MIGDPRHGAVTSSNQTDAEVSDAEAAARKGP